MTIPGLPPTPTRDDIETHIADDCPGICGGNPQALADLDDATDAELLTYITGMHTWHNDRR